jgi:hypothetical protein
MYLSAFAALKHPESRAYYDRKIQQGKRHNQALLALARRRADVIYAMLRDGTVYQPSCIPTVSSVDIRAETFSERRGHQMSPLAHTTS